MFGPISRLFKSVGSKKKKEEQSPFAAPSAVEQAATAEPQFDHVSNATEVPEEDQEILTTGDMITLPLPAIMKQIPKELLGIDAATGAAKCKFRLPKEGVAKQLESGSVKIRFGTIRKSIPSGIFINTNSKDEQEISLPLNLIIKQLDPTIYQRRTTQQIKEIPPEIQDLFGPKGEGLTEVRILKKEELRTQSTSKNSGVTEFKLHKTKQQAASGEVTPAEPPKVPGPKIEVPNSPQISPSTTAAAQVHESSPTISGASLLKAMADNRSANPAPAETKSEPEPVGKPAPEETAAPAAVPSSIPFQPSQPATHLSLAVAQIKRNWPEPVLEEVSRLQLEDSTCAFPVAEVKAGLQQGKLAFRWGQIQSWITPAPEGSGSSPHGDLVLDIPLDVATPLFLRTVILPARQTAASPAGIPDVFANQQRKSEPTKEPAAEMTPGSSPSLPSEIQRQTNESKQSAPAPLPPTQPAVATSQKVESGTSKQAIKIALASVSATWPGEVQKEIQSLGLAGTHLAVPAEFVESGLKAGVIEMPWSRVLSWISDGPDGGLKPANEDVVLKLPLDIIAPMFLQLRRATQSKGLNVPQGIPDLFSAKGEKLSPSLQQEPTNIPPAVELSTATPAPSSVSGKSPQTSVAAKPKKDKERPKNIAELFGEPKKKSWTPNEIVQRTSQLPGVSGALIALQDGLLVAGCLPPGWKTETLAAFIPQMFGRMSQYTKELSIGNLQCLSLYVEKGAVHVYSAGVIYFAVLGQNETSLPVQNLTIIANELSRHTK